jgi:hypothetical protein
MSYNAPSAHAPRFGTVAGLLLVALVATTALAIQVASLNDLAGVFGWNTAPDGATITSVTPGYPAEKAGIRAGDVVDYGSLNLLGRLNTVLPQAVYEGAPLTVRFVRSGVERTATMSAAPAGGFLARNFTSIFSGILIIIVGSFLVVFRPSRMTWGFLLIGIGQLSVAWIYRFGSPMLLWWSSLAFQLGIAIGWAGLLMFVSRFPTDTPRGWLKAIDRAAIPLAVLYFALEAYIAVALLYSNVPPSTAIHFLATFAFPALIAVAALVALIGAGFAAQGNTRQRLVPVIATFVLWSAMSAAQGILNSLYTTPFVIYYVPIIDGIALALFAFATAYGIVRHRVIDVSFIVSRTVVYTAITAILIGIFAIIDILVARWLEHSQLAIILELGAAVLIGVWLKSMHHSVDRFVDRVLFRRRHIAERRLDRVAKTLPHASSIEFVDEALVVEPAQSLELASGAVFRRGPDGTFRRHAAQGWNDDSAQSLDPSDHLLVQLEAELDVLNVSEVRWPRVDIPTGLCQPLLAVPIVVRHRLTAFALYGGHVGGEALDPDEIGSLRRLAQPAGVAYDYLEAEALRTQNAQLITANADLQLDKELNVKALDLMRRQMATIDRLMQERRLTPD